jgi:F-box protein, helicase, 18
VLPSESEPSSDLQPLHQGPRPVVPIRRLHVPAPISNHLNHPMPSPISLTAEQTEILGVKPLPGHVTVIDAIAGAGKTTTLRQYAETHRSTRFLYLCFNKAQATEATELFPSNVTCKTTHALAFGQTGFPYARNSNKGGFREPRAKAIMGPLNIGEVLTAHAVVGTVTRYLQSHHPEIGKYHLPFFASGFADDGQLLILEKAKELWRKMGDVNDADVGMSHDGYLKLWQVQCLRGMDPPRVFGKYDAILVDEAQDTNPAFEAILRKLVNHSVHSLIFVGDERQSIYQWRGAVNLLSRLSTAIENGQVFGTRKTLTESFRYGPRTARIATQILTHNNDDPDRIRIIGRGVDDAEVDGSHCFLSRTNAGLVDRVRSTMESDPRTSTYHFAATKGPEWNPELPYKFGFIRSVYHFFAGTPYLATDPEVKRFTSWGDILRHSRPSGQDDEAVDRELATAVNFVEKYDRDTPHILDSIVARSGSPQDAAASFSTAHRAKGLEWDRVTILNDFPRLSPLSKDEELEPPSKPELNLLYVAVTRGKSWVTLNEDLTRFTSEGVPAGFAC